MSSCGIRWGATIIDENVCLRDAKQDWSVTVEGEQLASPLNNAVLRRFVDAAAHEAGGAASYPHSEGRIRMTLTVRASGVDEAADRAAHTFKRALAAALWPRYQPSARSQWRIQVATVEPVLATA